MKPGQSTFDQRLVRINSGKTWAPDEVLSDCYRTRRRGGARRGRKLYLNLLVLGALTGGLAGLAFATKVGLDSALGLDITALTAMAETDPVTLSYIAAAAVAPVAYILTQVLARRSPAVRRLCFGYLCGVIAANGDDLQPHVMALMGENGVELASQLNTHLSTWISALS